MQVRKTKERCLLAKIAYRLANVDELSDAEIKICHMLVDNGYMTEKVTEYPTSIVTTYHVSDKSRYLFI